VIGSVPDTADHERVTVPAGTVAPLAGLELLGELGEEHCAAAVTGQRIRRALPANLTQRWSPIFVVSP
jgi:hypothetical protein